MMNLKDFFRGLHFVMQVTWLVFLAVTIVALMFDWHSAVFYLWYMAFLIGWNHVLVSLVVSFSRNGHKGFRIHLVLSSLVIGYLYLAGCKGNVRLDSALLWTICAGLAIYFWYLSFTSLNPYRVRRPNVFDL